MHENRRSERLTPIFVGCCVSPLSTSSPHLLIPNINTLRHTSTGLQSSMIHHHVPVFNKCHEKKQKKKKQELITIATRYISSSNIYPTRGRSCDCDGGWMEKGGIEVMILGLCAYVREGFDATPLQKKEKEKKKENQQQTVNITEGLQFR